jgi:hypothetical protein
MATLLDLLRRLAAARVDLAVACAGDGWLTTISAHLSTTFRRQFAGTAAQLRLLQKNHAFLCGGAHP